MGLLFLFSATNWQGMMFYSCFTPTSANRTAIFRLASIRRLSFMYLLYIIRLYSMFIACTLFWPDYLLFLASIQTNLSAVYSRPAYILFLSPLYCRPVCSLRRPAWLLFLSSIFTSLSSVPLLYKPVYLCRPSGHPMSLACTVGQPHLLSLPWRSACLLPLRLKVRLPSALTLKVRLPPGRSLWITLPPASVLMVSPASLLLFLLCLQPTPIPVTCRPKTYLCPAGPPVSCQCSKNRLASGPVRWSALLLVPVL